MSDDDSSDNDNGHADDHRTDWAQDRTIMANERTFNSWMGLALGAVAVAIGLKAVFGEFEPTWAAKLVASMFLAIAIAIYWMARRQAQMTQKRLDGFDAEPVKRVHFTRIASALTVATLGVGAVLWAL